MSPAETVDILALRADVIHRLDKQDDAIAVIAQSIGPAVDFYTSLAGFGGNLARFGRELARFIKWGAGVGASLGGIYVALHLAGKL